MSFVIRMVGTLFDGQFLEHADLEASATSPPSYPTGDVIFTRDPQLALKFWSPEAALVYIKRQSKTVPLRPDGEPNRPLTAFSLEVVALSTALHPPPFNPEHPIL